MNKEKLKSKIVTIIKMIILGSSYEIE